MKHQPVSLRLEPDLRGAVEYLAATHKLSMSAVVRKALRAQLGLPERHYVLAASLVDEAVREAVIAGVGRQEPKGTA